jgi:hypothetical protein
MGMFVPSPSQGLRLPHYHSIDTENSGPGAMWRNTVASATAYPTANLAIYVPIRVRYPVTIRKLWVPSGTTGTGNFDLGLYNAAGTRLVSTGSQAKGTSAVEQVIDVTDTPIAAGLYYLAICADSGTDTYYGAVMAAPLPAAVGVLTQDVGSVTLPATASWGVANTLGKWITVGALAEATVS